VATKSKASGGGSAKERVAAMRAAEKRKERLRWLLTFSVVAVIVAALAGGAVWAVKKSDKDQKAKDLKANASRVSAGPPWAAPADPLKEAKKMGLEVAAMEGNVNHFHTHLDIFVDGQQVPVAEQIGIGPDALSELHTHDTTGLLHVESSTAHGQRDYNLGQLFREWELPFSATVIGNKATDATHTLKFYVNGKEVTTDPAAIKLVAHDEIAIVYGTADENAKVKVPSTWKFAEGE
jgi:hypothetical protein